MTKNEEFVFFCSKLVINSQEAPQIKYDEKYTIFYVKLTIFMRNLHEKIQKNIKYLKITNFTQLSLKALNFEILR